MSNPIISGDELGMALAKALCIDTERLEGITIIANAGEAAHVTTSRLVTDKETNEVATVLETYRVELIDSQRHAHLNLDAGPPPVPDGETDWTAVANEALQKAQEENNEES